MLELGIESPMPPARTLIAHLIMVTLILVSGVAAADDKPVFHRQTDQPVALVANDIAYDSIAGVLTATGAVEVYFGGRTLTADKIVYNSQTDRISAEGRITLRTEAGETLFADAADLDTELQDGLIRGARSVISNGVAKISAVEAQRVDNRYNVLSKAVFSPCEVCANNPTPLWRIRARQIIHDEEKGEIHYDQAYFDLAGVTVGFLPYFRHPSPEVKRASGFLEPEFEIDGAYGAALKVPYFLTLGDSADLTVTPFISAGDGALLEIQYRRLFERGSLDITIVGGVTDYGNDNRGFRARIGGFGTGEIEVDPDVYVGFELEIAADDPFLRRYDYTDNDRLTSEAYVRAYGGRNYATVTAAYLQSLRANDPQNAIPYVVPEFDARYVLDTPFLGDGEFGLTLNGVGLIRENGRDSARVSLGADWSREVITDGGMVLRGFADARADYYQIGDDPTLDDNAYRLSPRAGIEARMPFSRADESGGRHVIEPIVQFVVAPEDIFDGDIPNDDSVLSEFDTLILFETDRQTGFDRIETGSRVTVGGRYQRFLKDGFSYKAAAGRIFRIEDITDFSPNGGLVDDESSYVASLDISYRDWAEVRTSWRFSDDFGIERADILASSSYDPFSIYASYFFVEKDAAINSSINRSELTLGGSVQLDRNWSLSANARRDLIADRFVTAGAILSYVNECGGFDAFVKRRFTEAVSAPEATTFGLRVRLFGAGGGDQSRASGACAYGAE